MSYSYPFLEVVLMVLVVRLLPFRHVGTAAFRLCRLFKKEDETKTIEEIPPPSVGSNTLP
jgi:hypothetical protein